MTCIFPHGGALPLPHVVTKTGVLIYWTSYACLGVQPVLKGVRWTKPRDGRSRVQSLAGTYGSVHFGRLVHYHWLLSSHLYPEAWQHVAVHIRLLSVHDFLCRGHRLSNHLILGQPYRSHSWHNVHYIGMSSSTSALLSSDFWSILGSRDISSASW